MAALVPSDSGPDSGPDLSGLPPIITVEDLAKLLQDAVLKDEEESKLTDLKARKAEVQNELATSSSNEDKTQLEGELVTIEKEIISAVANIESFERRIQYFEGKLQEERDLEKEKHRKKESKRLLNEAMKEGYVLLHIINVLLAGVAGSGKTSVIDLLMGKPPKLESDRHSTPCMERPVRVRPVTNVRFQNIGNEWKEIDRQKQIDQLAYAIRLLPRGFHESLPDSLQKRLQMKSEGGNPTASESANPGENEGVPSFPDPKAPVDQAITAVKELVTEALSKSQAITLESEEGLKSKMVYLTDCGGQRQFQDVGSLFVRHTSAALLPSRLIDDLCSFTSDEYFKHGKLVGTPYPTHITHGETLMSLLRSLRSHNQSGKNPICLFIGTFFDRLKELGILDGLDKRNKALLEMLPPEILQDVVFSNQGMNKLIFPVNALSRDDHTLATAQAIRNAVEKAPSFDTRVPIRWLLLELALQELCSGLERGVLTLDECRSLAQHLGFRSESVDAALDFFDEVCIAHYYPMVLPNTVFVNPQVPLDKVSELTEHAISLREAKEDRGDVSSTPTDMEAKWKRFRDEGIITLDILMSEQFQKHYLKGVFIPSDLLLIMRQLLIVAPLSIHLFGEVVDLLSEVEYFMPTLLRSLPPSELEEQRVFNSHAAPLLIRFPSGCVRCGVFCCLVVFLMKMCGWKVLLPSGNPVLLARNCVKFSIPQCTGSVTLVDTFSQIEVYVKAPPRSCDNHCPMIKRNLLDGVEAACKAQHYNNDHPVAYISCPHKTDREQSKVTVTPSPHYANLDPKSGYWSCSNDIELFGELEKKHKVWMMETANESTLDSAASGRPHSSQGRPSVHGDGSSSTNNREADHLNIDSVDNTTKLVEDDVSEISREVSGLESRYETLARHLHLPSGTVCRIRRDYHYSCRLALDEIIVEWTKMNYEYVAFGRPTWRLLVAAVYAIDRKLAKEIASKHRRADQ